MSWAQGRTLHTTRTGRAKPNGKVTKKSHSVRKTKYAKGSGQDRPLPFGLACHPQVLTRTPVHPGCATNKAQYNVHNWAGLSVEDFCEGVGTHQHFEPGDWFIMWAAKGVDGDVVGYLPPTEAMQYKFAAERMGVRLNVYQPTA